MGQHISYELEGITYIGYLALPKGEGKAPGVLVCHEGPGISENTFTKADRLADLGFVAFALDYQGDGKMVPLEDMITKLRHGAQDGWLEEAVKPLPYGRLVEPAEVARACLYLASDASGLMSGANIDLDQSVHGAYDNAPRPTSAL